MERLSQITNKFKYILIAFLVILLVIIIFAIFKLEEDKNKNVTDDIMDIYNDDVIEPVDEDETIKNVFVDIKGEVLSPGVYEVSELSNIIDVINISGGLTEFADTSLINLSKKVYNEMVIIIYNKDEVLSKKEENKSIIVVEECVCPSIVNDACLENISSNNSLISINNALLDELMTIPGIGESKALDIINYRNVNGKFNDIAEIKNVSGIGDSTFDKIKNYITL